MKLAGPMEITNRQLRMMALFLALIVVAIVVVGVYAGWLDEEKASYMFARRRQDIATYSAYLVNYPNGKFAREAKRELDKLYAREYWACVDYIIQNSLHCMNICNQYFKRWSEAMAALEDPAEALQQVYDEIDAKNIFQSFGEEHHKIEDFLRRYETIGTNYVEIHRALVELYQAHLKLCQLAMTVPPADDMKSYSDAMTRDYQEVTRLWRDVQLLFAQKIKQDAIADSEEIVKNKKKKDNFFKLAAPIQ